MNIGLITVKGTDYHPNRRLLEAAEVKGHRAVLIDPYLRWPRIGSRAMTLIGPHEREPLDVVIPRQGATVGDSSMALLRQLAAMGMVLVNGPDAIAVARDKFRTLQRLTAAGLPTPDTILCNSAEAMAEAYRRVGGRRVVVKDVSGRQGLSVKLVESAPELEPLASAMDPAKGLLLQRFIDPRERKDLRVLVIGDRVVAGVELTPPAGEFRANIHLGGQARQVRIDETTARLAVQAARTIGLEVAGVDMMVEPRAGPTLCEVNYSPGFRGLEAATGEDVAGWIVEHAVARAAALRPGGPGGPA